MLFQALHPVILSKDVIQKPETLALRSNEILTAVIHGARKEEPSQEVQLAAIHALFNSLEFVRENFDREVS
jgi:importin subunit beta-1